MYRSGHFVSSGQLCNAVAMFWSMVGAFTEYYLSMHLVNGHTLFWNDWCIYYSYRLSVHAVSAELLISVGEFLRYLLNCLYIWSGRLLHHTFLYCAE